LKPRKSFLIDVNDCISPRPSLVKCSVVILALVKGKYWFWMGNLLAAFLDPFLESWRNWGSADRELQCVKETAEKFRRLLWVVWWLIMNSCWDYPKRKKSLRTDTKTWLLLFKSINFMFYTSIGNCWFFQMLCRELIRLFHCWWRRRTWTEAKKPFADAPTVQVRHYEYKETIFRMKEVYWPSEHHDVKSCISTSTCAFTTDGRKKRNSGVHHSFDL